MLPRVHFIETTMMRTLKPILANSKTLLKDMLMDILTVDELTLLLQKTAFSLVKSRLAQESLVSLFVRSSSSQQWPNTQENCW